jgi:hypothetical protein
MNTLKTFFASPLFGFLLKLVSGLAAAGFGLFGIGTKTRDDKGKLTRDGWIALIGVLVAGIIASVTSVYEFNAGQEKDRQESLRNHRLMLSVQRILYPIKGISGDDLELTFTQNFSGLESYKASLRQQLPPGNQKCKSTADFLCYDEDDLGNVYGIPATSRLFPKADSLVGDVLSGIGVDLAFIKLGSRYPNLNYDRIGGFGFSLQSARLNDRMVTYSPGNDRLGYAVRHFEVPDKATRTASVSSLIEVFPGFISATASVDRSVCDATKNLGVSDCLQAVVKPISDGLEIKHLSLRFPYAKGLSFDGNEGIRCKFFDGGEGLLLMLPDDIEHLDQWGNFDISVDPHPYERSICADFMNPAF